MKLIFPVFFMLFVIMGCIYTAKVFTPIDHSRSVYEGWRILPIVSEKENDKYICYAKVTLRPPEFFGDIAHSESEARIDSIILSVNSKTFKTINPKKIFTHNDSPYQTSRLSILGENGYVYIPANVKIVSMDVFISFRSIKTSDVYEKAFYFRLKRGRKITGILGPGI